MTSDTSAPDAPPTDGAVGASTATGVATAAPGSPEEGGAASAQTPRSTEAPPRGAYRELNPFDRPTASPPRDYTEEDGAVSGVPPPRGCEDDGDDVDGGGAVSGPGSGVSHLPARLSRTRISPQG